jgi:hypothetical protein
VSNNCGLLLITEIEYRKQIAINDEIGKLLFYMYSNPDKFGVTPL